MTQVWGGCRAGVFIALQLCQSHAWCRHLSLKYKRPEQGHVVRRKSLLLEMMGSRQAAPLAQLQRDNYSVTALPRSFPRQTNRVTELRCWVVVFF